MSDREGAGDALAAWPATRGHRFLRAYSDAVNQGIVDRWLPAGPVDRLLKTDAFDEAAGAGLFPLLRTRAREVVAVDVSETARAAARRRYPALSVQPGDVRQLDFPEDAFEAVVSNSTLDHLGSLDELRTAVRELHRVMRSGGTLVLTLDNPVNPLVLLRNALPYRTLRRLGLVQYRMGTTCRSGRLRRIVSEAGFEVREVAALMHVPRVVALALAAVVPPRRLLGPVLAVEALARSPTRYVTGQFVAVRAVKR